MRGIATILLLLSLKSLATSFPSKMQKLSFNEKTLRSDLAMLFTAANLNPTNFQFTFEKGQENKVSLNCQKDQFHFLIRSIDEEMTSTTYKAIREIGFLFPHPRKQISPTLLDIKKNCSKNGNGVLL